MILNVDAPLPCLRSSDLFLLSPTATRRRALVLWVRATWNEGRGGGWKKIKVDVEIV